jgi:hypothetical protein
MRQRRPSLFSRALDVLPVVGVLGLCVVVVFIAMNVLVTAAPIALNFNSPSPSPSDSVSPSLLGSPTALPLATDTSIPTPAPAASVPDSRPTIINSAISESDPNGVWTVYMGYPSFLAGTTPWADAIDADIGIEIQTRVTQWEQGPASNRQVSGKMNVLSGVFKTELLTSTLASFTLTWEDDASASQPATGVETLNYDLSTGQRIAFDDLFSDPDVALIAMSKEAESQLIDQLGPNYDQAVVAEGISPSRTNFIHWAITAAGIKITFAEHQVAKSLSSLPSVVVPWANLRSAMVQTGPVAKLAGF